MLFNPRTKKAIRYVWIGLSILIVISMVITFSGFHAL